MRIEFVGQQWERRAELEQLLYDGLYRDFGVAFDAAWRHEGEWGAVAIALGADDELLGAVRLLPHAESGGRQVRQLVVVPGARMMGVGSALIGAVEAKAAEEGASAIVLNARDTAFGFYQRLGYEFTGSTFVSETTRIPHRPMCKCLRAG